MQDRYGCPRCRHYQWESEWWRKDGEDDPYLECGGCGNTQVSLDMLLPVIWFYGTSTPYFEFSNFYTRMQWVEGAMFRTNEHWFQSMKSLKPEEQAHVRGASSPALAKKWGRNVHLQAGWGKAREVGKNRDYIMFQGLWAKVTSVLHIGTLLLFTGDLEIRERSPRDHYWGGAHPVDVNRLGALLMAARFALAVLRGCEPCYVPIEKLRRLTSGDPCGHAHCARSVVDPPFPPCPRCGRTSIIGEAYVVVS